MGANAVIIRVTPTSLNRVLATTTAITASSFNTAFPPAWLRDPLPTKRWRSAVGWNIVAGFNDKIDFNRGGVKVATIAAASYTTSQQLCLAIVSAMTTADGGATWTCTYDPTTFKFTLGANLAFTLLFSSGANVATGAGKDLGFAVADTGSAVTQLAGNASYHSREYVLFDMGSAVGVTVAALVGHNMGTSGTITLYGKSSANPWLTPGTTQAVAGDDLADKRIVFFSNQSFRYFALVIDDVQNSNAYSEFGVAVIGTYWSPSRGYDYEYTQQSQSRSEVAVADQGALFYTSKQSPIVRSAGFIRLSRADRDLYVSTENEHAHVLVAFDPVNYVGADTVYGVIPSSATIKAHRTIPTSFDLVLVVAEQLG